MSLIWFILPSIILSTTYANVLQNPGNAGGLTANSALGRTLLQSARRLNDDGDDGDDGYVEEQDLSWLYDFSLKFQGCHYIKQWNSAEDDENDVRIKTTSLARFRLCPSSSCSKSGTTGCSSGYGDYVVDVDTYVSAYVEAQREQVDYDCQTYMYKHCDCQDSDDKDDGFDVDICEYNCYTKSKKYDCIEQNPYYDDDASTVGLYKNDLRDFEKYFAGCSQFQAKNNRKLEEDETTYYIGSYCADQGGKIYLGMFTDDTCTNFADRNAGRSTYKEITGGQELPFSVYSMVRSDCVSCTEQEHHENDQNNGDDDNVEIRVSEACQDVYQSAGKCETRMTSNYASYVGPSELNENSCYFIEGIKIVRKDGLIDTSLTRPNKVVSFFIFLFAVSFVLLGAYIYYLRMKLGMKINLE